MIDENGNYHCDYCLEHETGEYYTETGNHVTCQDLVELRARIAALDAVQAAAGEVIPQLDDMVSFISSVTQTNELATVRIAPIIAIRDKLAAALDAAKP